MGGDRVHQRQDVRPPRAGDGPAGARRRRTLQAQSLSARATGIQRLLEGEPAGTGHGAGVDPCAPSADDARMRVFRIGSARAPERVKPPNVAGMFYPGDRETLRREVDAHLGQARAEGPAPKGTDRSARGVPLLRAGRRRAHTPGSGPGRGRFDGWCCSAPRTTTRFHGRGGVRRGVVPDTARPRSGRRGIHSPRAGVRVRPQARRGVRAPSTAWRCTSRS